MVNIFGKGSYIEENSIVIVKENKQREIQGANSHLLKYSPVICSYCNNTKTQPFDIAYSEFINYIDKNKDLILHQRFINFQDIYKENFEEKQRNLYKYFVKSFGCRLADNQHKIPEDMIELLDKDSFQTALRITFAINEDKLLFDLDIVGNGAIYAYNKSLNYTYDEFYKWLHIFYYYDTQPNGSLGSTWIADNQYIYLGSFYSALLQKDRDKLLKGDNV